MNVYRIDPWIPPGSRCLRCFMLGGEGYLSQTQCFGKGHLVLKCLVFPIPEVPTVKSQHLNSAEGKGTATDWGGPCMGAKGQDEKQWAVDEMVALDSSHKCLEMNMHLGFYIIFSLRVYRQKWRLHHSNRQWSLCQWYGRFSGSESCCNAYPVRSRDHWFYKENQGSLGNLSSLLAGYTAVAWILAFPLQHRHLFPVHGVSDKSRVSRVVLGL